jgi:predicted nucleotidyltransferase
MVDPLIAARRIMLQNDKEAKELELRRCRAQDLGRVLARTMLAAHPDAKRVWGFGSVFETWRNFRMTSDIDLAVEGGDIFALMTLVEDKDFSVDVVDLSSCQPAIAEFIRDQGIVLAGEMA